MNETRASKAGVGLITGTPSPFAASSARTRNAFAVLLCLLPAVLFRGSFADLIRLALNDEHLSHVVVIPFLALGLIYWERARIFRMARYWIGPGIALLTTGVVLGWCAEWHAFALNANDTASLTGFGIVVAWFGAFLLCYGPHSSKAALSPLLFLFLVVPFPSVVLPRVVYLLQKGSAETVDVLFRITGIPAVREGFSFALPGVDIEIAEQCSGIRSSMSLLICGLLAGHFLLAGAGRKLIFAASTLLIAVFKNGLRIVTLSYLGVYVNPEFLHGKLHHQYGGLVFSLVAITMLGLVLCVLRRGTTFAIRAGTAEEAG